MRCIACSLEITEGEKIVPVLTAMGNMANNTSSYAHLLCIMGGGY